MNDTCSCCGRPLVVGEAFNVLGGKLFCDYCIKHYDNPGLEHWDPNRAAEEIPPQVLAAKEIQ